MSRKSPEVRIARPVVTPRNGVRIGSAIRVGNVSLLEVKHGRKTDYISIVELIEQVEEKKVVRIVFQDTTTINKA